MLLAVLLSVPLNAISHGVISATAKITHREFNIVEIQVQFDLINLLNHNSKNYPLPIVASLPNDQFGQLYNEVKKLFARSLKVKIAEKLIPLNHRFPSQDAMFGVISRQFLEQSLARKKNVPYTFSDRRFYQVVYFDFRVTGESDINQLAISFPKELGNLGVTFVESFTKEVHSGSTWTHKQSNH
jgi:hypothetical protein